MRRAAVILGVLIAVMAIWAGGRRLIPSSIDYRGEKVRLTKFYLDYDDYKDDPDNIDPSENSRVQKLLAEAPIATSFPSRKEAVAAVFEIKFPGYGAGGFGPFKPDSDGILSGLSVEIPRSDKSRYFIFRNQKGRYILADDFVCDASCGLASFHQEGKTLIYEGERGERRLVRPMLNSD